MKIKRFYAFMRKREFIRQGGKPAGKMSSLRLPNIRREDDTVTKYLIQDFYGPNRESDFPTILYNALMVRYFGTINWAQLAGWQTNHDPEKLIEIARKAREHNIHTNAYMTGGAKKGQKKYEYIIKEILGFFWNTSAYLGALAHNTQMWEPTAKAMKECPGFSPKNFMVREVLLDTFYCDFWQSRPKDYDKWFPLTLGAKKGIVALGGPKNPALQSLYQVYSKRFDYWPHEYTPLRVEDVERQLAVYGQCQNRFKTMRKY